MEGFYNFENDLYAMYAYMLCMILHFLLMFFFSYPWMNISIKTENM